MIVQPICQLFERLKEAVQVHLVVVTSPDHVLINYIVMRLQNVAVCQAGVLAQPLEL